MSYLEEFLRLLSSIDTTNVTLALEMAKGLPDIDVAYYLNNYKILYQHFFDEVFEDIDGEQIVQVNELKELDMSFETFERLSKPLSHLFSLQNLILHNHKLIALPDEIKSFVQLQSLSLICNYFIVYNYLIYKCLLLIFLAKGLKYPGLN
ncbi:hypothetical protein [Microscilla marina]|uniref:hypothetical protein n=1 Tax=Microscilla marina TaxID=1027 RepID=UPI0012FC0DA4|nr:hypothetical protein [Microscilla marina]